MSWQTYVDNNLIATGKISNAAILGQAGGVWAISPGYTLSADEQKAAVNAFSDPAAMQASGVRVAGRKFFVLQANDRSVYGKLQADGVVLVRTKQAVLVAEYTLPNQAGEVTVIVEGLADYLISVGY